MREVAEQARTSWRGKLSLDREKYVEAAVRRKVGPKAQQLDRGDARGGTRRARAPGGEVPGSRRGRALTSRNGSRTVDPEPEQGMELSR